MSDSPDKPQASSPAKPVKSKQAELAAEAKKKKAEQESKAAVKAAIKRQEKNEKMEIKQSLNFVFGETVPKKKKELLVIKDLTPVRLWMEKNCIFNEVKSFRPLEIFHPIEVYALKWQPPRCKYTALLPLDDPQLQENMLIQLHNMIPSDRKNVIFFFAPRNPSTPLFAPRVHPSSLVSYRTNDKVLRKLCDQYIEGRIGLTDLQSTLTGKYDVWRLTCFNLLPADEQEYHEYLTEKTVTISQKDIEKQYYEDIITLAEFKDLQFPERKAKRLMELARYPEPYATAMCVICGLPDKGIITCQNCTNKVCTDCIHLHFLDEETREGSFLLMHRKYCLRLGNLPDTQAVLVPEPAYMRELRATGRAAALETATHIYEMLIRKEQEDAEQEAAVDSDNEEEQRLAQEEANRLERLRIEEEARRARECPPELVAHKAHILNLKRKLAKGERDVLECQEKIEDTSHTEQFQSRQLRLKQEALDKLESGVRVKLQGIKAAIVQMSLEGLEGPAVVEEVDRCLEHVDRLKAMTSRDEYLKEVGILAVPRGQSAMPGGGGGGGSGGGSGAGTVPGTGNVTARGDQTKDRDRDKDNRDRDGGGAGAGGAAGSRHRTATSASIEE